MNYNERLTMCRDAMANKKTEHYAVLSPFNTGMIFDIGHTFEEACYDWDVMLEIMCETQERYNFDLYGETGTRNPFALVDPLGVNIYKINSETQAIGIERDIDFMEPEEYDEIIEKGSFPFIWSKVMRRRCTKSDGPDAAGRWRETFEAFNKENEYFVKFAEVFHEKYQVPDIVNNFMAIPLDNFFNFYRGIKGLSIDLHRKYDKVREACDVMMAENKPLFDSYFEGPVSGTAAADIMLTMLVHSILNQKQFADLYWRQLKPYLDKCAETGRTFFVFAEAQSLRLADFRKGVPDGTCAMMSEQDDVFELRKQLPNLAVGGGIPAVTLSRGTKEENIERVKKVIDELGDHGLIISVDKMVSYKADFDRDNMLAIIDYVHSI